MSDVMCKRCDLLEVENERQRALLADARDLLEQVSVPFGNARAIGVWMQRRDKWMSALTPAQGEGHD